MSETYGSPNPKETRRRFAISAVAVSTSCHRATPPMEKGSLEGEEHRQGNAETGIRAFYLDQERQRNGRRDSRATHRHGAYERFENRDV